jgi:amino acid permease
MGICIAYVNRIFTFVMQLVCYEYLDQVCYNKHTIFIIVLALIIPLSMIRKLSTFSLFSGFAIICVFITVVFIVGYSFYNRYLLDMLDKEYNSDLLSFSYYLKHKHNVLNLDELPVFYGLL